MFDKLCRPLLKACHFQKPLGLGIRKCHAAVPLSFTEYSKNEPAERNLIVVHGLFGSKANWYNMMEPNL
jgi:hypothetical protein